MWQPDTIVCLEMLVSQDQQPESGDYHSIMVSSSYTRAGNNRP